MVRSARSKSTKTRRRSRHQVVETYFYRDQQDRLRYQLVRFEPKDFEWQKPNGKPWSLAKRPRLLYRLPELLTADPGQTVFIVEGEKDVDRLVSLGLVATCNDGGGGRKKWSRAHSQHLNERSVVILPDNDRTGHEHAEDVAYRLRKVTAELRIVRLPDLPRKGDDSDWLDHGGTSEELIELCSRAPLWTYSAPSLEPKMDWNDLGDAAWSRARIIESHFTVQEKLLLIILSDTYKAKHHSLEELASYMRLTPRRVSQLLAGLKRQGVVSVYRLGRSNHYSVCTYKIAKVEYC